MSEPITQAANPPETTATVVVSEADRREEQFLAIGRRFNQETLAATYALDKNKTEDELRRAIAQAIQPVETIPVASAATIATRAGEQPRLATAVKRYGKLRNFTGEGSEEKAYRFGMWFLGSAIGIKSAQRWCNENGILTRTQNESVNEQGGFLVPEEFGTDLIDLREQYSVFRRNAKIVPMATDTRTDPRRTGGLTAYFTGESDAITESNKTWDRVSLTAKKLSVLARMTSELSEDSAISIADDLAGEIAYAFGKKEDECGFVGTGSSTFGGIVGATEALKGLSGTIANIAGLKVGTGNAYSELTLNDFIGTVAKLPEFADMNAKWYVHKLFYHDVMVRAMLAAGGVTAAEIESARNKTFLGYPVEFTQVMPKVEANSQVCALFGDLAMAASMGVRRDTTIALSEHSRFANDEIEIRGTERFDINVHSVGNASATAADREAGALVGLITAAA
jgi:HK97 family phage major capsid protein